MYQVLLWGGRRMQAYRADLPEGPVGESWDLADHPRGMSRVAEGPLQGASLRELVERFGTDLVGEGFAGGPFPLMVKLIDATDRLSVQVHPDDALARELGLGDRGKTECWYMLADGGELFVGTGAGIDRARFEAALRGGTVEAALRRFVCGAGDFFFLPARTVHALGRGCLLYEVQQTCDLTFRVWDWGRVGLDGKPRTMHVAESLRTIDFTRTADDLARPPGAAPRVAHPEGGLVTSLVACEYFTVELRELDPEASGGRAAGAPRRASIVTCLSGAGELSTPGGTVALRPAQTVLVPAAAGGWRARADQVGLRLLHAEPVL